MCVCVCIYIYLSSLYFCRCTKVLRVCATLRSVTIFSRQSHRGTQRIPIYINIIMCISVYTYYLYYLYTYIHIYTLCM